MGGPAELLLERELGVVTRDGIGRVEVDPGAHLAYDVGAPLRRAEHQIGSCEWGRDPSLGLAGTVLGIRQWRDYEVELATERKRERILDVISEGNLRPAVARLAAIA